MLRKSSLPRLVAWATLVVLCLVLVPFPVATQEPLDLSTSAAQKPVAGVYWVRLRPPTSVLPTELQAALRKLRAEGQVLDFEHLPERGALRVVAFAGGLEDLAGHRQVAEVEPLHVRPVMPSTALSSAGSTIQETYHISGTARTHDGTPLAGVAVYTHGDDPDYAYARSNDSGVYRLAVDAAGTYHLRAYKSGLPSPPMQVVTVPPDASGIDFRFPPTYTVSGVVRDQNGQPVAGADIHGGLSVGTTAADGSYTIADGPGEQYVSAAKDGYQSPYSVLVPLPPAATGVNLLLLREDGTIQGRIVDDRGVPVADASVWADNVVCGDWGDGDAETAADGTYTLTVPSGIYHVEAFKDGYVPTPPVEIAVPSGPPTARVDMVLNRAPHAIRGTVRDSAGQPLDNTWITASMCGVSYGTRTNASGTYTLPVEAGTYAVDAYKTNHTGAVARLVSVPPDASGVDFTLSARTFYTITGRVTDPTGQPLEDIVVETAWRRDPYDDLDWTDEEGRYTLQVPAGTYHISAFEHGYTRPAEQAVSVPPSQADVDFVLTPTGLTIRGTIRDSNGVPLPTGRLSTWLPGETMSWVTRAYYDGTYVRGMVTGTHDVLGSADCHASAWVRDVTLPPSRSGIDLRVAPADQLISGIVRDTNGALVCDAKVYASPTGSGAYDSVYTARNGRYALQVPSGTYTVRASKGGYGPAPDQAVTVPPHARRTDFTLRAPDNTIQGAVRDDKGRAVEGATVRASNTAGSVTAPSGADGRYVIQVFDGVWGVSASKAGYVTFSMPRSVSVPPDRSGVDFMMISEGDLQPTYLPLVLR